MRACRDGDAAAVTELINAILAAGGGHGGHVVAEIEDVLRHEVKDLAADTRVVTDAAGGLVGVALVPVPPEGGDRVELIGGVHPGRRGAGIGRELLAWQLERAAARHAEVAPGDVWQASVVAGVADAPAIRLYERLGFTVVRYFLEMAAPVTPPPVVPAVDGLRITPYHTGLERAVYAVHSAAFRELWGHQVRDLAAWTALTVRSEAFRPELSRVAFAGDDIVGYVLSYDGGPGRLSIGQVGTAASWRRRGVASALLAEVLGAAGRSGCTTAALDADTGNPTGAAGIYAKAGFVIEQHIVVYHKPVPPAVDVHGGHRRGPS